MAGGPATPNTERASHRDAAVRLCETMIAGMKAQCDPNDAQQVRQLEALELAMPGFMEFVLTARGRWFGENGVEAFVDTMGGLFASMLLNALNQFDAPPDVKQAITQMVLQVAGRRVKLGHEGCSIRSTAIMDERTGEAKPVRREVGHA